jgi:uncharacterized membrane protein
VTVVSSAAVTLLAGFGLPFDFRCAGLLTLLTWIVVTLAGTVPINEATLTWDASAPPKAWRMLVARWERLAIVRCWLAVAAFGLFLVAMVL